MSQHPKAIEAQQKAAERVEERKQMQEAVHQAKTNGVRFVHVGRTTIAYLTDVENVVLLSTTIRNPQDVNDKLVGRYGAAYRLSQGNCIMIRIPKHVHPTHAIRTMFETLESTASQLTLRIF